MGVNIVIIDVKVNNIKEMEIVSHLCWVFGWIRRSLIEGIKIFSICLKIVF